jgi:hypothetical protein
MTTHSPFSNGELPASWDLLTLEDQSGYLQLRRELETYSIRTRRDLLAAQFETVVMRIWNYCARDDGNDSKRFLVCGMIWLPAELDNDLPQGAFAVSTRQLCKLIKRCKSSANTAFQSLGYVAMPMSIGHTSAFLKVFPSMRSNLDEMRQWTIRGPLPGCRQLRFTVPAVMPVEARVMDDFNNAPTDWDEHRWFDGDGFPFDEALDF